LLYQILKIFSALILLLLINKAYSQQYEDVVYLKDGSIIRGMIIEQIPNISIKIETKGNKVFEFKMDEIEKIKKEKIYENTADSLTKVQKTENIDSTSIDKEKKSTDLIKKKDTKVTSQKNDSLKQSTLANEYGYRKGKSFMTISLGYSWGFSLLQYTDIAVTDNFGMGTDVLFTTYPTSMENNYTAHSTVFGLNLTGNYHLSPKKHFDPYVKGGIGFYLWLISETDNNDKEVDLSFMDSQTAFTLGYTIGAGANYFFSKGTAINFSLGYPVYFSTGILFNIK